MATRTIKDADDILDVPTASPIIQKTDTVMVNGGSPDATIVTSRGTTIVKVAENSNQDSDKLPHFIKYRHCKTVRKHRHFCAKSHPRATCNGSMHDTRSKCVWCSSLDRVKHKGKMKSDGQAKVAADLKTMGGKKYTSDRDDFDCAHEDTTRTESNSKLLRFKEAPDELESTSTKDVNPRLQCKHIVFVNVSNETNGIAETTASNICYEDRSCQVDDTILADAASSATRRDSLRHQSTQVYGDDLSSAQRCLQSTTDISGEAGGVQVTTFASSGNSGDLQCETNASDGQEHDVVHSDIPVVTSEINERDTNDTQMLRRVQSGTEATRETFKKTTIQNVASIFAHLLLKSYLIFLKT